ncbi:MAG: hypothetical protein H0S85_05330 [Desulfovibrionaceae bacterium]|jgi:hypothetical protein|nr:hypothetical protein [Desulfovibrionaceae bacterium]
MQTLSTPHGAVHVSGPVEWTPDGRVRSCQPCGESVLHTGLGDLTPQHTTDDLRRRTVQSLEFHDNGMLKSLPLERPTVVQTPAGPMRAEMVTFHPGGAVSRVFPLNGRLSGYWSQEDEAALAEPVVLATPLGVKALRVIGVSFGPGGWLRSLTLWPDERLEVETPAGRVSARMGVSFFEDGQVRSLEPAEPVAVRTPVGSVRAFDPDAVGVNGDVGSLSFAPGGALRTVSTVHTAVAVAWPGRLPETHSPQTRESLCGEGDLELVPMRLEFDADSLRIRRSPDDPGLYVPLGPAHVTTTSYIPGFAAPLGAMRCSI